MRVKINQAANNNRLIPKYDEEAAIRDSEKYTHFIAFDKGGQFGFNYHLFVWVERDNNGKIIAHQQEGTGNDNRPHISKEISEEDFQLFLSKLDELKIINFDSEYVDENLIDGMVWHYEQYGSQMKNFHSYGYGIFPNGLSELEDIMIDLLFPN